MFFRGTQIQRHGHGRCVLLPKHGLSSNSAKLSSSRAFAPSETILHTSCPCVATHTWQVRDAVDCKDRIPFHVTRARCLAHLPEMLMRDVITTSLVSAAVLLDCLSLSVWSRATNTRAKFALRSQISASEGGVKARG